VAGRNILMCDDMISTAGTVCSAAALVKERGAKKIYVGATHGVFAADALTRLADAPIDEVVVTDTIPLAGREGKFGKVKVLTAAPMLGEAIKRIHRNESISILFDLLNKKTK
jgi:ribose-phosphate pyrophosphokinase